MGGVKETVVTSPNGSTPTWFGQRLIVMLRAEKRGNAEVKKRAISGRPFLTTRIDGSGAFTPHQKPVR